ncbi:SDR family oxidoreductase [Actinoplanes sp. RD1]|uniref:SDR family oxidoreductase n=1 Tax=Actinoplanes sp. RD1 TaxID=3064538 RepID=UPI0027407C05|nr:SDR family oxidoreductase [Actinoplanes sp. RD1]
MNLENKVALVTGANRGLGRHFAEQLLARGAKKVYATARRPELIDLDGVETLPLDITDPASVAAAAAQAPDVTLLINNAGAASGANLVAGRLEDIRADMDTFFYGTLAMIRAFAPILRDNGGGAILNVNSASSWVAAGQADAYHAAKAAEWAMTNAVRQELAAQRTQVTGFYLAMTDTGHQDWWPGPLNDAAEMVAKALDGLEAGTPEVIADDLTAAAKAALAEPPVPYTGPGN